ncbi:MAG: HDOD domain-containing protein [Gammaproteobacteria bacterium]
MSTPLLDIKPRIAGLKKLPPMPEMAQKIIMLGANPDSQVKDLVEIVEMDPSLAAQVMRYASSPFFSYQGKVDSVQTAITRVLGFNMVMQLALGVTAAKPFKIPRGITLGLDNYWRHAIYSAALTQALSSVLPSEIRPPAGLAYLAGLLHNFGHLMLGHLFTREFLILNKHIDSHPEKSIIECEMEIIGTGHGQIGEWLMRAWRLPEEIIVAVKEHHNPDYQGQHEVYPKLVMLADHLLKAHGIGDAPDGEPPQAILDSLELGEYQANIITNKVMEAGKGLDGMARTLAA